MLTQQQVDGMEAILTCWDTFRDGGDLRFLAYMLATTFHETAQTMWPIEEIGKGEGHEYGETDPETGQAYYGRGFVQLTWRDNYARADFEIEKAFGITPDMEWVAANALIPKYAAGVMFLGMEQGWFRSDSEGPKNLARYFNDDTDDPYQARDIINGDLSENAKRIEGYHDDFFSALTEAYHPAEIVPPAETPAVDININISEGVQVSLSINGTGIYAAIT